MPSFEITQREARQPLLRFLQVRLHLSPEQALNLVRSGQVRIGPKPCRDPARPLRVGQHVDTPGGKGASDKVGGRRAHDRGSNHELAEILPFQIRYLDPDIVVVDKPPGVTTMRHPEEAAEFGARGRRYLPPTLAEMLPAALEHRQERSRGRIRPVHRLDKDTSGLVVFARTPQAEQDLGKQFRAHSVERTYLALVRGERVPARIESHLIADRGDGRRGSSQAGGQGKRAVTHARVLEKAGGFALVECRLETGRTHQVRIHLGEAGVPLCGERIYDRPIHGAPVPDGSGAPRLALHAASLGIVHPRTGKRMQWESGLPEDLASLWNRLRKRGANSPLTPPSDKKNVGRGSSRKDTEL